MLPRLPLRRSDSGQSRTDRSRAATAQIVLSRRGRRAIGLTIALAAFGSIAGFLPADAATVTTTTVKPGAPATGAGIAGGGSDREFCRQVTESQTAIGKATGDASAKLKATAAEWVKIESTSPATIKASVTIVRTAYQSAAKAGTSDAVKVAAVTSAGAKITTFVSANCRAGGAGGFGGGAELTAYRECLAKQGVTLATPGSGSRGNVTDPKMEAAMKACADKLPAGAQGGFGRGAGNFTAIRECLTKKGITLPAGGFGGRGGYGNGGGTQGGNGGGTPPVALDAKTQKAMQECQAAAQSSTTTTKK